MMERGGDLYRIIDDVFNTRPLSTIMLWSKALGSVSLGADGRVIYIHVTPRMLEEAGSERGRA